MVCRRQTGAPIQPWREARETPLVQPRTLPITLVLCSGCIERWARNGLPPSPPGIASLSTKLKRAPNWRILVSTAAPIGIIFLGTMLPNYLTTWGVRCARPRLHAYRVGDASGCDRVCRRGANARSPSLPHLVDRPSDHAAGARDIGIDRSDWLACKNRSTKTIV
jgi:hypothetical protein